MMFHRLALCSSLTLALAGGAAAAPVSAAGVEVRSGGRAAGPTGPGGPGATTRLVIGAMTAPAPGMAPAEIAAQALRELAARSPALVPQGLGPAEIVPVGAGHV